MDLGKEFVYLFCIFSLFFLGPYLLFARHWSGIFFLFIGVLGLIMILGDYRRPKVVRR